MTNFSIDRGIEETLQDKINEYHRTTARPPKFAVISYYDYGCLLSEWLMLRGKFLNLDNGVLPAANVYYGIEFIIGIDGQKIYVAGSVDRDFFARLPTKKASSL